MAMSLLRPRTAASHHGQLLQLVSGLERPCLHALALGLEDKAYFQCFLFINGVTD